MGNQTHVYIWDRNCFSNVEEALIFYNSPEYNEFLDDARKINLVFKFLNRISNVDIISGVSLDDFRESALTDNKNSTLFYEIMREITDLISDTNGDYYIYTETDR